MDEVVNGYHYDQNGKKTNYTFHHDHLRSVTAITAHEGSTLQTAKYGPFGDEIEATGNSGNHLKYTGREHDTDTGLYYYRARYYDPSIGRFITEDPLGFEAGVNFYAYVLNDPVNANDPSGLAPGDVYAFEPNSLIGNLIAGATDGPFSHIGIELMGGRFLEAVPGEGVRISDLAAVTEGRNFDVFRSVNISTDAIPSLENFAEFVEGQPYDNSAIFGVPTLNGCEYVCSTLVNDASSFSGLGGIPGDASNLLYDFSTPNDILTNDSFQLIGSSSLPSTLPTPPLSAGGGFVLYPNKANTNMLQGVYAK